MELILRCSLTLSDLQKKLIVVPILHEDVEGKQDVKNESKYVSKKHYYFKSLNSNFIFTNA